MGVIVGDMGLYGGDMEGYGDTGGDMGGYGVVGGDMGLWGVNGFWLYDLCDVYLVWGYGIYGVVWGCIGL